ncbi:putative RDD family membrane protein YckC [Oikeobacillus pervagus]|uniref:RDD family membrane protein YckC n=1 Tax=Oikeobacillus pervagus TaxID=1325931 RepID=A0AAJ1WIU1_9BACI|nr:RDD family protein [Oikeobacillus pervagus]MDQ0215010.1 putative RDD family membrane protein YckC [Oikeobacillus pervagus]
MDQDQFLSEQRDQNQPVEHPTQQVPIDVHYAGFWMRFWAYLVDLIVIGSISRLFIYPTFRSMGLEVVSDSIFSPVNIATAIVFYLYFILFTKYIGQTLGKMVFGLKVVPVNQEKLSWGTVLFRELVGRYISATLIFLYLLVAILPKKQGLHDYFADTVVVHERSLLLSKPAY